MKSSEEFQTRLQDAFNKFSFHNNPANLYEPVKYILSLGAKRMRPQLVLMGCDLFGGDPEKAVLPAMGIEFFHNFTLMHDDIMDNAPLRRAKETVHKKWNPNIAILSGDAMFVQSIQLVMQVEQHLLKPVLDLFTKTALEVCEGQQLDMDFETTELVTIPEYIHMIGLKTAVLLGASLQIGALIAGAESEESMHLYSFGKNMGTAFQLQDDYLDVYGDSYKFGKQVGGDILSNKKTFLLLKAFELSDKSTRNELDSLMLQERDPVQKVQKVKAIYDRLKVPDYSSEMMGVYLEEGMKHLAAIGVPDSKKYDLKNFAESMMKREN